MRRVSQLVGLASALILAASTVQAQGMSPPGGPALLIARGDAALRAGDTITSLGLYRDAVARSPRDPRGYLALGNAYLAVDEPKNALEVFEAGARNTRPSEALSLGLARCYALLGKGESALLVLRKLAAEGVGSRQLFEALAEQAEAAGAFVEALSARRSVLSKLLSEDVASEDERRTASTRVAALQLLLGKADRLATGSCQGRAPSVVLDALLACPARP